MDKHEKRILAELKALAAKLGLADRVRFAGFIADADLADYYRAADLFVLSSRYEPFGMIAIEAMACGTPTVVTIHGGLFRAVTFGRHALYADTFDKEDLGITCALVPAPSEDVSGCGSSCAKAAAGVSAIRATVVSKAARMVEFPLPIGPMDVFSCRGPD